MSKKTLHKISLSLVALALAPLTGINTLAATDKLVTQRFARKKNNLQTAKERQEIIRKIIAETLGADLKKVVANAHFVKDLGGDSIALTELRFQLEEKFNLKISNEQAEKMPYVRDVFAFVESHYVPK
ncbi:MAG TPA: acyl carrier protein [Pyrinomonadaceae bacterium]|jgi:acyl carrier protein